MVCLLQMNLSSMANPLQSLLLWLALAMTMAGSGGAEARELGVHESARSFSGDFDTQFCPPPSRCCPPFSTPDGAKDDFAAVREKAFPGDRRQFGDMRRSGATEADLGGVDPRALGKTMANRLDQDEALQSTYVVGESKKVQDARRAGRNIHSARFRKTHSD